MGTYARSTSVLDGIQYNSIKPPHFLLSNKSDKSLIERATKAQDKIPLHFPNREPLLSFHRLTVLNIRSALELEN